MTWPLVQLRRILRLQYGNSLAAEDRVDGGVPVFGSNGVVGWHDTANTQGPAIVVGRKGSFGKVQFSFEPVFAIDTTFFVDQQSTASDLRWLFYVLQASRLDELSDDVGVPGLSREKAYAVRVALPDAHEQRKIADFLDAETARIDALIEKKQRLIALLEERRVSMTDSAIWDERASERSVAALAAYVNGWPFKPDDFTESGLPVIRIAQLVDPAAPTDYFDGVLPDRVRLQDGDLIFSWSASLQVRIWDRGPAYLNQHLYRVVPWREIDRIWLRFALDAATRRFAGLMHGSAMTHLTQPMMKQVRVPVPDAPRQRQIASQLDDAWRQIDSLVEALATQIDLLNERRQALISAAVTGQLDVAKAAA